MAKGRRISLQSLDDGFQTHITKVGRCTVSWTKEKRLPDKLRDVRLELFKMPMSFEVLTEMLFRLSVVMEGCNTIE